MERGVQEEEEEEDGLGGLNPKQGRSLLGDLVVAKVALYSLLQHVVEFTVERK